MTTTVNLDTDAIVQAGLADPEHRGLASNPARGSMDVSKPQQPPTYVVNSSDDEDSWPDKPTEEELHTLRRVSGKIKWNIYTIAFVELCERFSYYGSAVLYTNFINHPLPEGSTTGATGSAEQLVPGALGMGPKAAQGLSLFNQFFAYLMPLLG